MARMRTFDRRWNKIWLFFLIIVIGLLLSIQQVGKGYEKSLGKAGKDYYLLRTEKNCDLEIAPCAAFAPDYALVLNMKQHPGWESLSLRAAGEPLSQASRLQFRLLMKDSDETRLLPVRFLEPDTWFSDTQLPEETGWRVRVEIERDDRFLVADFPLPAR